MTGTGGSGTGPSGTGPSGTGPFDIGTIPAGTPAGPGAEPAPGGVVQLGAEPGGALLVVPAGAEGPVPLLVFFHGSGGRPQQALPLARQVADLTGVAVLAPKSVQHTWDAVVGPPGPDVAALRRSLAAAARVVPLDAAAVGLAGFSDGASYALTLGLANPQAVQAVLAFSPGYFVDGQVHELPRFFVSHGTGDRVLPIARTSHRIVPLLRSHGYDVEYVEFDGGHEMPEDVVRRALTWWQGGA